MTELLDLSRFKNNDEKDNSEDIKKIAEEKFVKKIKEGIHEVTITRVHEKDGSKYQLLDLQGGTLSFNLVISTATGEEQILNLRIPLQLLFTQAVKTAEKGPAFVLKRTIKNLNDMGIDPILVRESIINTNGKSIENLVGAQFILKNSWPSNKLHLEYENKDHYFVTSQNERFEDGELAAPYSINFKAKAPYDDLIAIAKRNGHELATQMDVEIKPHPTASNDHINEALRKLSGIKPKEEKKVKIACALPEDFKMDPPPQSIMEVEAQETVQPDLLF